MVNDNNRQKVLLIAALLFVILAAVLLTVLVGGGDDEDPDGSTNSSQQEFTSGSIFLESDFIAKTEEEAVELATSEGYTVEITSRNGVVQPTSLVFEEDKVIRFEISAGRVSSARITN